MIYWFTGQPAHGKTTIANLLVNYLRLNGVSVFHVDGDHLRDLTLNKDYSRTGRLDNVRGAQKISHYLHNEGYTVVVSLVSPYRNQREELKTMIGDDIVEFYVTTDLPRERDHFKVEDYESPLDTFVLIDTTVDNPEESLLEVIEHLRIIPNEI